MRRINKWLVSIGIVGTFLGTMLYAQDPEPNERISAFATVYAMNPQIFGAFFAQQAVAAEISDADKISALASFLTAFSASGRNPTLLYDQLNVPARELALVTTIEIADVTSATLQARMDEIVRLKTLLEGEE